MFMNYMDYVDDSSMVMFSQGQVDRMHYALDIFRPTLQESNGCGVPYLVTQPEFTHASSESASDGAIHLDIAYGQAPFTIICQDTVSQTIVDSVVLSSYGNYSIVNLSEADYLVEIIDSLGESTSLDFSILIMDLFSILIILRITPKILYCLLNLTSGFLSVKIVLRRIFLVIYL